MGTRADLYVGPPTVESYLGSIAWDGYPSGIDDAILGASTEAEFRNAVTKFLASREDASLPERDGWPWPWDNSGTTDYGYVFVGDHVVIGSSSPVDQSEDDESESLPVMQVIWPDMSSIRRTTFGPRSGLIAFGARP